MGAGRRDHILVVLCYEIFDRFLYFPSPIKISSHQGPGSFIEQANDGGIPESKVNHPDFGIIATCFHLVLAYVWVYSQDVPLSLYHLFDIIVFTDPIFDLLGQFFFKCGQNWLVTILLLLIKVRFVIEVHLMGDQKSDSIVFWSNQGDICQLTLSIGLYVNLVQLRVIDQGHNDDEKAQDQTPDILVSDCFFGLCALDLRECQVVRSLIDCLTHKDIGVDHWFTVFFPITLGHECGVEGRFVKEGLDL